MAVGESYMRTGQVPWEGAQLVCIVMKQGTACVVRHPLPLNGAYGGSRILRLVEDVSAGEDGTREVF